MLFRDLDLNRLLDTRTVEALSRLAPVCLQHELKGVAKALATFIERATVGQRAGNFFDPSHEASMLIGFDDRMIALLHSTPF